MPGAPGSQQSCALLLAAAVSAFARQGPALLHAPHAASSRPPTHLPGRGAGPPIQVSHPAECSSAKRVWLSLGLGSSKEGDRNKKKKKVNRLSSALEGRRHSHSYSHVPIWGAEAALEVGLGWRPWPAGRRTSPELSNNTRSVFLDTATIRGLSAFLRAASVTIAIL